jgi:hypothetical protein
MTGRAGAAGLLEAIRAAQALIRAEGGAGLPPAPWPPAPPLPSLLDQCRALQAEAAAGPEPLRSLHHLACTGGTLIARCLAVMPNVRLLNEIAPLSRLGAPADRVPFLPSDLIGQLKLGHRPAGDTDLVEIFLAALAALLRQTRARGERLVLRDHAHSQFCHGPAIHGHAALHRMIAPLGPVLSAVTVRHPLDSYLALLANGWEHFAPRGLDEYARRSLAFLDAHAGLPLFRYEDILEDPPGGLARLCAALRLPFHPLALDTFGIVRLSGDSGRSGDVIGPRPRRDLPPGLAAESAASPDYDRLCARLGYAADPAAPPTAAAPP